MKNFCWYQIKSLFRSTNRKNNFLLLDINFSASLLCINTTSAVSFPGINPYCILSISTKSRNCPSKTFSYNLKACFNKFICHYEFGVRVSSNAIWYQQTQDSFLSQLTFTQDIIEYGFQKIQAGFPTGLQHF